MVSYVQKHWFPSLWFFAQIQREIEDFKSENQSLVDKWISHKKDPVNHPKPDKPLPPKEIRNFALIPLCSPKLKHVQFTHPEVMALIAKWNLIPERFGYRQDKKHNAASKAYYNEHKDEAWNILFKMDVINKTVNTNERFNYRITTNTVDCSIDKVKTKKKKKGEKEYLKEIADNHKKKEEIQARSGN